TDQLLRAFDEHQVPGAYLFNNTAPVDDDSGLLKVFDAWCEAGHHIGNHTHHHASLNWVTADQYIRDIDTTEKIVAPWVEQAPDRYFRFAFDMWGDSSEKTGKIQTHLVGLDYKVAPVSYWFYDAQFMVAYNRALELKDSGAQQ